MATKPDPDPHGGPPQYGGPPGYGPPGYGAGAAGAGYPMQNMSNPQMGQPQMPQQPMPAQYSGMGQQGPQRPMMPQQQMPMPVMVQTMSTPYRSLQSITQPVWCGRCQKQVQTVTTFEPGSLTHLVALALYCFTGCLCWIPYVVSGMQDVVHSCPSCQTRIAVFHRSGRTEVLVPETVVQAPAMQRPMGM